MKKKYNILFIITDQQRKDTLGCYDNELIRTPHIDKLAAEGIQFNKAYCESPICMPSRATLHTGKKAIHHGVTHHNDSMRPDEQTIAHVLAEKGYVTKCIGKMHLTSQQHRGREESIADWRDGVYKEWQGPYYGYQTADLILGHSNSLVGHYGNWLREHYPEARHRFVVENMEKLPVSSGQGVYNNDIPESLHSSSFVGDRTVKFLQDMKESGKPFFCFASFPDPHWPIMPPKAYYEMYDDVAMPPQAPDNGEADKHNYPRQFGMLKRDKKNAYDGGGHYVNDQTEIEAIMRPYWGAVSWIDVQVGKMLQTLKELEMEEDTIVIFTTDHGEYMGAHGMMAKGGFVWEELINVPLIIRCPDLIPAGQRTDALFSFIDVVPTLLDLLEVAPSTLAPDGVSQKSVLTGDREMLRDRLTVTHFGKGDASMNPDIHSLITPEWKLNYYAGDDNGELYNLKEDPQEMNNLYHDPGLESLQRELIRKLLDELILVKDKSYEHRIKDADRYGKHAMHYEEWKSELEGV